MNYSKKQMQQKSHSGLGLGDCNIAAAQTAPQVPNPTLRYGCVEMQSEIAQVRSKVKSIRAMIFGEDEQEKCGPDVGNAPIPSVVYSLAECHECVREIHEVVNSILNRL